MSSSLTSPFTLSHAVKQLCVINTASIHKRSYRLQDALVKHPASIVLEQSLPITNTTMNGMTTKKCGDLLVSSIRAK